MPKPTTCFSILNAVASLPDLHNLSDAGSGAGLMGFTPANNSEMIAIGRDITGLSGTTPQPRLWSWRLSGLGRTAWFHRARYYYDDGRILYSSYRTVFLLTFYKQFL
ncbi:hypothetical protein [Parendozoicomonas sp. Alg238-R29]|uniref:hypothetical protein n=1 Tax=Parendozoicomonas sp. Alg238-R29 TaxID=2993446 RepID=UPI00248F3BBF|nr:hypothetical protein [Parendozoicomonas sp. Alg238-R29]